VIVEADLDGAELRVICALSGEQLWKHVETCEMMFGKLPPGGKSSDEYKFAKSSTFRWLYTHPDKPISGDPGSLRTYKVNITYDTLSRFSGMMSDRHANITAWKRQQLQVLRTRKRVYNAWGRYRDLRWALMTGDPALLQHAENVALNFPIQTAIGEVMDVAFNHAWEVIDSELYGIAPGDTLSFWTANRRAADAWLWGQVHDSLVAYAADPSKAERIARIFKEAIEQPIPELGGLVISADVKCLLTWGTVQ
jgi:hypothetical protein